MGWGGDYKCLFMIWHIILYKRWLVTFLALLLAPKSSALYPVFPQL